MSLVSIDGLWVRYGKVEAVKGVSLEIPKGEVFGFIGPNGAGKSSTIKVLATLLTNYRGLAYVNGVNVAKDPYAVRSMIGYMPDYFGVYEDLNTREYLHFFAAAYQISMKKRKSIIDDVLELTDLTNKIDAPVDSLSRGMKQRLSLARVLLHDPDLLLLDEPASGLDPRARIEMRELLIALKSMGKTILISSHILHELSHLCTRIGIIEAGEMIAEGSLNDIYRQLDLNRDLIVRLNNPGSSVVKDIEAIEGISEVHEDVGRYMIQFREDLISLQEVHDSIHALGYGLTLFQPQSVDMETVFMRLTEGRTA
jgi:ABC-2 type transport system ATP-binding protein